MARLHLKHIKPFQISNAFVSINLIINIEYQKFIINKYMYNIRII